MGDVAHNSFIIKKDHHRLSHLLYGQRCCSCVEVQKIDLASPRTFCTITAFSREGEEICAHLLLVESISLPPREATTST